MRRDEATRQGRAADALIASYLRELLMDDEREVAPNTARELDVPSVALTTSATAAAAATDATL